MVLNHVIHTQSGAGGHCLELLDDTSNSECDSSPFDEADDFSLLATQKPKSIPGSVFLRMYSCLVRAEEERNEAQRWNMRYREKMKQLRQEVDSVTAQLLDSQQAYRLLLESTRLPHVEVEPQTCTIEPSSVMMECEDVEMVPVWDESSGSSDSGGSSESEDSDIAQQLEFIRLAECEDESSGDETEESSSDSDSASLSEDPLDPRTTLDDITSFGSPQTEPGRDSPQADDCGLPDAGKAVEAAPIVMPRVELNLSEVVKLMTAAETNLQARQLVRAYLKRAQNTQRERRTEVQLYAMKMWRRPIAKKTKKIIVPPAPTPAPAPVPAPSTLTPRVTVPPASISLCGTELFVDASGRGIGMVWGDRWFAWVHHPNSPVTKATKGSRIDMSWAELLAVELAIHTMLCIDIIACTTIVIRSDNKGVVQALTERKWTKTLQPTLDRILAVCDQFKTRLVPIWVSTSDNLADGPSRGVFPDKSLKLGPSVPTPDHLSTFFISI